MTPSVGLTPGIDMIAVVEAAGGTVGSHYYEGGRLYVPGVTQAALDAAAINAGPPPVTADHVRMEARRRILARYPEWKQHNMTMRGVELQDIWRRLGAWTTAEQSEATALQAAADWIKSVRAASNTMEPNPPADYTADVHWPT